MSAFETRADLHRLRDESLEAKTVLETAISIAKEGGWLRHEIYLRRRLAHLLLDQNLPHTSDQFLLAVELAVQLSPPQPKIVTDLVLDLLERPKLGGNPSAFIRRQLRIAVDRMRDSINASLASHAPKDSRFQGDFSRLLPLVQSLVVPKLELATAYVQMSTGKVMHHDGTREWISRAQLALLSLLERSSSAMTNREISIKLDLTEVATQKRITRLRRAIGASNLVSSRLGNQNLYQLARK